jgi:hypothetical protein
MKEFRKTKEGLYICEECGKTFKSRKNGLCRNHIYKFHNPKEYYDKWLKEKGDDKCKVCNNTTSFFSVSCGYSNCCSKECSNIYRYNQSQKAIFEKYSVKNVFQIDDIKKKRNKTMKQKYGSEHTSSSIFLKNKREKTFIKKYGVTSYTSTLEFKEKRKQTCIKKYGVENNSQNRDQYEKMQKAAYKLKQFRKTNLWYQGSYELDFLEKYYDIFSDIKRGPSIKYKFNGKNRVYHSDFYIPSLNLVIECKNNWLYNRDKEILEEKKKATIANGFNYIMILDKNYKDFIIVSSS